MRGPQRQQAKEVETGFETFSSWSFAPHRSWPQRWAS